MDIHSLSPYPWILIDVVPQHILLDTIPNQLMNNNDTNHIPSSCIRVYNLTYTSLHTFRSQHNTILFIPVLIFYSFVRSYYFSVPHTPSQYQFITYSLPLHHIYHIILRYFFKPCPTFSRISHHYVKTVVIVHTCPFLSFIFLYNSYTSLDLYLPRIPRNQCLLAHRTTNSRSSSTFTLQHITS